MDYKTAKLLGLCVKCKKIKDIVGVFCLSCKNKHSEKERVYRKSEKYRQYANIYVNNRNRRIRLEVLQHYGGVPPKCSCCNESEIKFLQIDHIDGNGNQHRKNVNIRGGAGTAIWLKNNNYPEGFQVLCANCNLAKGFYGMCPHQAKACQELNFI